MKRAVTILFLFVFAVAAFAQTLSEEDSALLKEISASTSSIKSFTCSFTQVREDPLLEDPSVSKGQMQYRNDGTVVWKCTSPDPYQVTILKDKIIFAGGGKNRTFDVSSNHLMGDMQKLAGDVNSGKAFSDRDNFTVSVSREKSVVTLKLVPVKKIMQKHLRSMTMKFDANNLLIESFEYLTPEGVSTTIAFSDWKLQRND